MTLSCPSFADTHALASAWAVSTESLYRLQMRHGSASGPAPAADTAFEHKRKWLRLG
jgi:hypothetical protein